MPHDSPNAPNLIDVIVPVFKGLTQTRRCLDSVLQSTDQRHYELVVIDDCSPQPEIGAYLSELAEEGSITLLHNAENRGFVATANCGIQLHPDRDVVLLNSDTEVSAGWLDRLSSCAHSGPDIGTVTPFSNNGTICSYPFDGWDGGLPGGLDLASLDALFASANAGLHSELPTGVGFCLYMRRACIQQVGLFDEVKFGRGYGEENDFCMRAKNLGWHSVLAADVFVFHEGSVSFGAERAERTAKAEDVIRRHHPDYTHDVMDFLQRDPLHPLRERVDQARAELAHSEALSVLAERTREGEKRQDQLVYLGQERAHYRQAFEYCRGDFEQSQREAQTLKRLLSEAREESTRLDHQVASTTEFVRAREADVDALQEQRISLTEELGQLRQDLERARQDLERERQAFCARLRDAVKHHARQTLNLMRRQ